MPTRQLVQKFPPQGLLVRRAIPAELISGARTPNEKRKRYKEADFLPSVNDFLVGYSSKYGHAVGYDREKNGAIVQDIFPNQADEKQQISSSSSVVLQMHTETAFHPYKPDWVILGCVKGDRKAETLYATLDDVLYELDERTLWDLRQPDFITTVDKSFRTAGEPDRQYVVRPIVGVGDWTLTYDADLMKALTPEAERALKKLHSAIKSRIRSVVLEAGDVLVLNNKTTVHGRRPFRARYDGSDRWLKRVLARNELPPAKKIKDNVIITD